jgi:hypothetical protein
MQILSKSKITKVLNNRQYKNLSKEIKIIFNCLTSRGSGVRIPLLPQQKKTCRNAGLSFFNPIDTTFDPTTDQGSVGKVVDEIILSTNITNQKRKKLTTVPITPITNTFY